MMNIPTSMVPMVIESTGRGERAFDIFSLLLRERIIILGTPINDQIANLTVAQLLFLAREDPSKPIRMYINSPGGQVYAEHTLNHLKFRNALAMLERSFARA